MATCPKCKAVWEGPEPSGGVCPECGQPLAAAPREIAQTAMFDMTAFEAAVPEPPADAPKNPLTNAGDMQTIDIASDVKPRIVNIAPRKLSMENMAMITNTWQGAVTNEVSSRTSLKVDSKTVSGRGSSLSVNQRELRTTSAGAVGPAGADYELLEVIGQGGMGVVYSARQASVNRLVAIKMIKSHVAADAQRREKFLSEAVVTGDLDHPNIVPIYELGANEDNALFYSMKRVQGTPWNDVLAGKTLSENLEVLMKVADAVAFAHSNGVIHRDLKPENVMLGDFGEVLVMDWGLALTTAEFRHADFISGAAGMGGTPAYMAPEMVTGPFDQIGPASDIYLLGAILYEIVTGYPPHQGTTAKECLFSAARNEIRSTEKKGELIDIACRSLATAPANRYASVTDFQTDLRAYNSHCESTALGERAANELAQAVESGDYHGLAHALFGFQEALAMWDGNDRARRGAADARLAYAQRAKQRGDYELGVSLLEGDNPEYASLRQELQAAQRERVARQKWLTRFKRIAATLVFLIFAIVSVALVAVNNERNKAIAAKDEETKAKEKEHTAKEEATTARDRETLAKEEAIKNERAARLAEQEAEAQRKLAEEQRKLAEKARLAAEEARGEALVQKDNAEKSRAIAEAEERKAVLAKEGEAYSAYIARIGVAAAKIDENAFDAADSLLAACLPTGDERDLRDWEWGRLKRLCRQGVNYPATGVVAAVAFGPDGKWFVTAGEDKKAHVWDIASAKARFGALEHPDFIHGVAISPDGRLLATADGDGKTRVFRAADGKLVRTLGGHADRVLGATFSPGEGRWLLTWSRDKTARVWDVATGREAAGSPLRGHSWWVWSAAFSPDAKRIVTAGQDGKVIVWGSAASGESWSEQKVFLGHDGPVFAAAFAPDGQTVASAGADKRILVWDAAKIKSVELKELVTDEPLAPQQSRALEGHSAPVRSLAFSTDGQTLLSGGDDNTVRLWDVASGKMHSQLRGHSRPVQSATFSPDGRRVLSGGQEGEIKLWNLVDFKENRVAEGRVLEGHDDAILTASFSRDGERIVTASRDHTARVFEASTGNCLHALKEGHEFLASRAVYFHDDRWLLTAGGDDTVRVWDAFTGSQLAAIEGVGRTPLVAASRDGKWILTGKALKKHDPATGEDAIAAEDAASQRIAVWEIGAGGVDPRPHVFASKEFGVGHLGNVVAVALSPDGKWLFSGDEAGAGKLWDAATGAEKATLKEHMGPIMDATFAADSRHLLTAGADGAVLSWNLADLGAGPKTIVRGDAERHDAYETPVLAIALAQDGRRLLTLSEDTAGGARQSVVSLWNVDRAKLERELYRGPENLSSIAFADGERGALAAGADASTDSENGGRAHQWNLRTGLETTAEGGGALLDFTARREPVWSAIEAPQGGILTIGGKGAALWDPKTLEHPLVVFKPHGSVTAAGFSGDGKRIATGSADHRVKIWNAETARVEFQLPAGHTRPITSASFSPVNDHLLVTASEDGTARIWNLEDRKETHTLAHHSSAAPAKAVKEALFSADGKQVLTAGEDGLVMIWDVASGKSIRSLRLGAPALSVAISADGQRIVAGGANGKATLFDAKSGEPLVLYLGHTAAVNSVAFSPDGRRILTGSDDRSAKLWDTLAPQADAADKAAAGPRSGQEILTLKHHDEPVTSVAFSPNGRDILTAGQDGTAVVWLADDWRAAAAK